VSLLDAGAGPGSALWAAVEVWPSLREIVALERDPRMRTLGGAMTARAGSSAIRRTVWRAGDLTNGWGCDPCDLTVAGYVLGEIPPDRRQAAVEQMWRCTAGVAVLLEPGTPRGFAAIEEATNVLARAGAVILAPFPPEWRCLQGDGDWVHFSQRVARTRLHRESKGAALSYEDEKYSYVAASRHPGVPIAARVIRQPRVHSGHIRLVLCTASGPREIVVPRSRREAYRRAKDLAWGSAIPVEDAHLYGLSR
jgi:ribosomal protein RSM22 (predicted rRNA methylase)